MAVVRLNRLEAGYERPLVRIESAELQPGERVALTGDNGSGKTTLLKTLVGQLAPLAGRCECPESWRIGYLPQQGEEDRQFPLSVYEWVLSGFWARRGWRSAFRRPDHDRAVALLERFGLAAEADAPLDRLSGGQWQRARLARLLVMPKAWLVLDEPFNNVDEVSQSLILSELRAITRAGCALLCVVHDTALARRAFDTGWHLCDGHLHIAALGEGVKGSQAGMFRP